MSQASSILNKLQTQSPAQPERNARPDLHWDTMDISSLSDDMRSMVTDVLKLQDAERQLRKSLCDAIATKLDLPDNLCVRVAFKWGKLSVAIDRAPSRGGDATLATLAKRVR